MHCRIHAVTATTAADLRIIQRTFLDVLDDTYLVTFQEPVQIPLSIYRGAVDHIRSNANGHNLGDTVNCLTAAADPNQTGLIELTWRDAGAIYEIVNELAGRPDPYDRYCPQRPYVITNWGPPNDQDIILAGRALNDVLIEHLGAAGPSTKIVMPRTPAGLAAQHCFRHDLGEFNETLDIVTEIETGLIAITYWELHALVLEAGRATQQYRQQTQ